MGRLLLTLTKLLCLVYTLSSQQLIQTNIIFRHGDRSPIEIYPKDIHKAAAWPDGLGTLTKIGKAQQTRLGLFLRNRYKDFIKNEFDAKEIYVQSSHYDRMIMSAYSNLAGLYSRNNSVHWQHNFISWQPVPVHTIPEDYDDLIVMSKKCTRRDIIKNETVFPKFEKLHNEMSDVISLLSRLTGYDDAKDKLGTVKDTLLCEPVNGLSWPDWATWRNITCSPNSPVRCANRKLYDILSDAELYNLWVLANTTELHRFEGGPLVVQVLNNFNSIINDPVNTPKVYMYSGHDSTVLAVLSALGIYNNQVPQYTATILIELYNISSTSAKEYEVRVFYKNVTDSDTVWRLPLPGCRTPCTLERFLKQFESLNITDWGAVCHNDIKHFTGEEVIVITVCLSVVILLVLTAAVLHYRNRRLQSPNKYSKLQTTEL